MRTIDATRGSTVAIEADRTIFTLDTQQILELKKAGVSKAVLLKMLRSRREFEAPQPPVEETGGASPSARATSAVAPEEIAPHVVIIGGATTPPLVTVVVPQQYYYYVPFPLWGRPAPNVPAVTPAPFLAPEHRGFGRFINDGWRP